MIARSFDAAAMNALVNDPSIRPHVGGDPTVPVDLTNTVANPDNVFLIGEHGGFGLSWTAPRTYEVHTFILPEGRGRWALEAAREGFAIMAAEHGAEQIWTRVHPDARNVRAFTIAAGFRPAGKITSDLGAGPVDYLLYSRRL